jgi:hypothetical protein
MSASVLIIRLDKCFQMRDRLRFRRDRDGRDCCEIKVVVGELRCRVGRRSEIYAESLCRMEGLLWVEELRPSFVNTLSVSIDIHCLVMMNMLHSEGERRAATHIDKVAESFSHLRVERRFFFGRHSLRRIVPRDTEVLE